MKKIYSLMLLLCVALTLTCCGGGDDDNYSGSSTWGGNTSGNGSNNNSNSNPNGGSTNSPQSSLTYKYDKANYRLTISGSGAMPDYSPGMQPWHGYDIRELVIEEGCTYIGANAFYNDNPSSQLFTKLLETVKFPRTLQGIGNYAFANTLLTDVYLNNNLKSVGDGAFAGCLYLKNISLNEGLESVGNDAFLGCPENGKYFATPANLKDVGNNAFASWSIEYLTLNDKLENIGHGAFGTGILKGTITIPNSVKFIGSAAFSGSFSKVIIGTGLKTLYSSAFCSSARSGSFYINIANPINIQGSGSELIPDNNNYHEGQEWWSLYVPVGSKSAYATASVWRKFQSITESSF